MVFEMFIILLKRKRFEENISKGITKITSSVHGRGIVIKPKEIRCPFNHLFLMTHAITHIVQGEERKNYNEH